jgi:hypothetical protein
LEVKTFVFTSNLSFKGQFFFLNSSKQILLKISDQKGRKRGMMSGKWRFGKVPKKRHVLFEWSFTPMAIFGKFPSTISRHFNCESLIETLHFSISDHQVKPRKSFNDYVLHLSCKGPFQ